MASQPDQEIISSAPERWKDDLLRVWLKKTKRDIRNEDLVYFSSILDVPTDLITATVSQIQAEALITKQPNYLSLSSLQTLEKLKGKGRAIPLELPSSHHDLPSPIHSRRRLRPPHWRNTRLLTTLLLWSPSSVRALALTADSQGLVLLADLIYGTLCHGKLANRPTPTNTDQHENEPNLSSSSTASLYQRTLLLQRVDDDAAARKQKGCGCVDRSTIQKGNVPCTLGCGRMFRSVCDRA